MSFLTKTVDALTAYCGKISAWATGTMMLCTCFVVIARYAFGSGSIALQESVIYLHAFTFMLGASFALKRSAHVRVDIFYRQFSTRGRHLGKLASYKNCLRLLASF